MSERKELVHSIVRGMGEGMLDVLIKGERDDLAKDLRYLLTDEQLSALDLLIAARKAADACKLQEVLGDICVKAFEEINGPVAMTVEQDRLFDALDADFDNVDGTIDSIP